MTSIDHVFQDPAHRALVGKVVAADRNLDATLFASLFTANGRFRIGGSPALEGPAAIRDGVEAFFQMLDGGIEHRLEAAWTSKDALVWQAEVTWSLRDGRRISAPYVNTLRLAGELVSDYRVHVDTSVLAPGAAKGVTITDDAELQPVFVVFDVEPEDQAALIDAIRTLHDEVLLGEPGFVSTSLHASLDGRRLINYGQWASQADYERFLQVSLKRAAPPLFAKYPPDSRPFRLALQVLGGR